MKFDNTVNNENIDKVAVADTNVAVAATTSPKENKVEAKLKNMITDYYKKDEIEPNSVVEILDDAKVEPKVPIEVLVPVKDKSIKIIGKSEKNIVKKSLILYENEIKELLEALSSKEKLSRGYESTIKKIIEVYVEDKYYGEEYLDGNMNYDENNIDRLKININDDSYNLKEIKNNLKIVNNIIDNKELNITLDELTINKIERIKDKYNKSFTEYFNNINDENFELHENVINDKVIGTYVKCSAKFNKIYSDYAIEKSIKKTVIAEGLDEIKLRMLSSKIFNNILNKENQQYKYVLYFNQSLFKKERKLNSFLKLMNDPYSQSKILIAIDYKTLLKKKELIKKYRQDGYRFIVEMKDEDFNSIDTEGLLYCEDIFVNTENSNINEYYNYIPFNMIDKLYLTKQTILYEEMC